MKRFYVSGGNERFLSFALRVRQGEVITRCFLGRELPGMKARIEQLRFIETFGEIYELVDFTWQTYGLISMIRMALGKCFPQLKANARLLGEYTLRPTGKRVPWEELREALRQWGEEIFSEEEHREWSCRLDSAISATTFNFILNTVDFETPALFDFLLAVPEDKDYILDSCECPENLEVMEENLGVEEENPIWVYSYAQKSVFRLGQSIETARPVTSKDIAWLTEQLPQMTEYSFTKAQFEGKTTLLEILAEVATKLS